MRVREQEHDDMEDQQMEIRNNLQNRINDVRNEIRRNQDRASRADADRDSLDRDLGKEQKRLGKELKDAEKRQEHQLEAEGDRLEGKLEKLETKIGQNQKKQEDRVVDGIAELKTELDRNLTLSQRKQKDGMAATENELMKEMVQLGQNLSRSREEGVDGVRRLVEKVVGLKTELEGARKEQAKQIDRKTDRDLSQNITDKQAVLNRQLTEAKEDLIRQQVQLDQQRDQMRVNARLLADLKQRGLDEDLIVRLLTRIENNGTENNKVVVSKIPESGDLIVRAYRRRPRQRTTGRRPC